MFSCFDILTVHNLRAYPRNENYEVEQPGYESREYKAELAAPENDGQANIEKYCWRSAFQTSEEMNKEAAPKERGDGRKQTRVEP
jgi:hypothetical protein